MLGTGKGWGGAGEVREGIVFTYLYAQYMLQGWTLLEKYGTYCPRTRLMSHAHDDHPNFQALP